MKEATGELNMTVVTIIAIGAVIAFFWLFFPTIKNSITGIWSSDASDTKDQHTTELTPSNGGGSIESYIFIR